jgi:hypothetical protein
MRKDQVCQTEGHFIRHLPTTFKWSKWSMSLRNLYAEVPKSQMTVLGGGASMRLLGHGRGTLMNRMSALQETPGSCLSPSSM